MKAFVLGNDIDFTDDHSHEIGWKNDDCVGLIHAKLVVQKKSDTRRFSNKLVDGGECPVYYNTGCGFHLVSAWFRQFLEDSGSDPQNLYQFLTPNFVTENPPKFYLLNMLMKLYPFPNGIPKRKKQWVFKSSAEIDALFRADVAGTPSACGKLAEELEQKNFNGLWLGKVAVID